MPKALASLVRASPKPLLVAPAVHVRREDGLSKGNNPSRRIYKFYLFYSFTLRLLPTEYLGIRKTSLSSSFFILSFLTHDFFLNLCPSRINLPNKNGKKKLE